MGTVDIRQQALHDAGDIWAIKPGWPIEVLRDPRGPEMVSASARWEQFVHYGNEHAGDSGIEAVRSRGNDRVGGGSVAMIPVYGPLQQRETWMSRWLGWGSYEAIAARLREELADDGTSAIILDIDSPGGSVYGLPELAAEIQAARGQGTRIVAFANALAASAAYWLGASADEFFVTPSGEVGSIGTIAFHVDESGAMLQAGFDVTIVEAPEGGYKSEGNPWEPLDTAARDNMQERVNEYYGQFVAGVAKGRGVSRSAVKNDYGRGRVFGATEALQRGMVDRVATFGDVVKRAGRSRPAEKASRAGALETRRRRQAAYGYGN